MSNSMFRIRISESGLPICRACPPISPAQSSTRTATELSPARCGCSRPGVTVELHQWPGMFHGSQAILSAEVSQWQMADLAPCAVPWPSDVVAADQAAHTI